MACGNSVVCRLLAMVFVLMGSLVFFIAYNMLENTSYNIASRHMVAVHNYACHVKTTDRVYVVVMDVGNILNQTTVADIIVGKIANTSAVVSTSYTAVTANQYFQYTSRMPMIDQYGLYFDTCAEGKSDYNEATGIVMAICYTTLFVMFWVIVVFVVCADCLCAAVCRRGQYEVIN